MKALEIREFKAKEIQERIDAEKNLYIKQKINHAITPLDNPMKIKQARRNIARMMTVLHMKQLSKKSND
jgi:large subunit ribosomal protein L29